MHLRRPARRDQSRRSRPHQLVADAAERLDGQGAAQLGAQLCDVLVDGALLVRDGKLSPERVTAETAAWDDAAEAVASHGGKLVISR